MSDPVTFENTTPRLALPLLYAGQARKEVFVNEALAMTDALLHCTVAGEAAAPPANPADGENWLVASDATGEWAGQDLSLACRQAGGWIFIPPRDGMRIFDLSSAQERLFFGTWRKADLPAEPLGGSTVDQEARTTINHLIAALQALGVLPLA
jgi:hypothetical protein